MKYAFLAAIILYSLSSNAQALKSCSAHDHFNNKLEVDLSLRRSYEAIQKKIKNNIQSIRKEQSGDTLIIPVVFHIIHNGDMVGVQENVSEMLILEQLQQINDDFSRQNTDASNTPSAFLNIAADTEIQFCLAGVDPTGALTSGIVRTHINTLPNVDESDCWTEEYIDDNIISPLIWNRNNYLNIFTVIGIDKFENGSCEFFNTLGYGQFPGGPANTDAVVVAFYTIGSLSMPNPVVNNFLGRTCTHEIGHWLNLYHLWGPNIGGCNQDDGIVDTPLQFEATTECNNFPLLDNCTTSGNGILFMNFMDYSDDDCMNLFTAGQRGLMRSTIFNARTSLIDAQCSQEMVLAIKPSVSLSVEKQNGAALISILLSETDNLDNLTLEKSNDLDGFKVIYKTSDLTKVGNNWMCQFRDDDLYNLNYYKCNATFNDGTVVSSSTEVVENNFDKPSILIYPSPSTTAFTLKNLKKDKIYHVYLYDAVGQCILIHKVNADDNLIPINSLIPGVYIVLIESEGEKHTQRIIVGHK